MSIAHQILSLREAHGWTQNEFATMLNVSVVTVSCWERGTKQPSVSNLVAISEALHCSVDELILSKHPIDFELKTFENKYLKLDRYGRDAVNAVCDAELARMSALRPRQCDGKPAQKRYLPLYRTPSAAGVAAPVEGDDFEMVLAPCDVSKDTDYLVRISGQSMEPEICDGNIVCVSECKTLRRGDIGIFCVNGAMYCKKYIPTSDGDVRLSSVNRQYAYSDVVVAKDSMDSVVCCGKVVGVITSPLA